VVTAISTWLLIAPFAIGLNARYYNELKVKNRFDGQFFP